MKYNMNTGLIILSMVTLLVMSCEDDRALVQQPDFFKVEVVDYNQVKTDTIVVNVNEKLTFNFPDGCTDEILFYPGESGKEYRFGERGIYKAEDGTKFESKITVNTTVNSFSATVPLDFSLVSISGLGKSSSDDFVASAKTEMMKLRAGSLNGTSVNDSYLITATSTPLNLFAGDINLALVSKSADATKNMLSVSALGFVLTNTEVRDYGYSINGVNVVNQKTLTFPVISNVLTSAGWAQYAPLKTKVPGSGSEVDNAAAYTWNMGETGVNYAPAITGGAVALNANGVALAVNYPVSVTAPADITRVVAEATSPAEAWLISRVVNPCAVKPDAATVIKRVDQSSVAYYQYIYKERGIYKASVVGINVGTNGTAKIAREFVIVVKNSTDIF